MGRMGIDRDAAAFLRMAARSGVDFTETCTLGRQRLTTEGAARDGSDYADAFFVSQLGAVTVESVDNSDYEGATILHDLNSPEPPSGCAGRFTAVVDGGTLEHVFNVPNALASMMQMCRVGGHVILMNPMDGQAGHGLYQFSPELFLRSLDATQGFTIRRCLVKTLGIGGRWYDMPDPSAVGHRVEPRFRSGAYGYVLAERVADVNPLFRVPPQQGDYAAAWAEGAATTSRAVMLAKSAPQQVQHLMRAGFAFIARIAGPRMAGLQPVDIDALPE